ncbi:MAG: dihydroneopterin aldolase, partial [Psychrobacter sp.]
VVFVKGLKVEAVIGVYEWERAITQPLLIDIALETDISAAVVSDDVGDALSYKEVCDDVSEWCKEIQAKLLEHLAGLIVDKLLKKYNCQKITFSISKPTAIAQADAVGVQITRYAPVSTDEPTDKEAAKDADNSQADDA